MHMKLWATINLDFNVKNQVLLRYSILKKTVSVMGQYISYSQTPRRPVTQSGEKNYTIFTFKIFTVKLVKPCLKETYN
jgi:hypothetical protein